MPGIISYADKTSLTTWLKYYQHVQAVDISTAPNISWPTEPE
nr:tail fiber assembly protein [Pantoea stewartii]